ncbi:hypothetical protein B0T11DRAFT_301919 [Plectosphaerella cucumerina]|uniref:Uncharacterized protein n=1 Tax=Plectosphaerella cucumerina TaxID=40658 RepID=A0A8K0TC07_9PEZI|nr:hypothetical protein B0T11DRAFT_301919 [Plectosphaerella cucumerina]
MPPCHPPRLASLPWPCTAADGAVGAVDRQRVGRSPTRVLDHPNLPLAARQLEVRLRESDDGVRAEEERGLLATADTLQCRAATCDQCTERPRPKMVLRSG